MRNAIDQLEGERNAGSGCAERIDTSTHSKKGTRYRVPPQLWFTMTTVPSGEERPVPGAQLHVRVQGRACAVKQQPMDADGDCTSS